MGKGASREKIGLLLGDIKDFFFTICVCVFTHICVLLSSIRLCIFHINIYNIVT